ncbi:hypothetical protein KP509_02G039300 [Ceratopteris richardii]|nr:hypothetical protein KP509_02G039300 [Ceratopteris richardii]
MKKEGGGNGKPLGRGFEHVSETEILIAQVLVAMKDCSLSSKEPRSPAPFRNSEQDKMVAQTSSQARATSRAPLNAKTALQTFLQKRLAQKVPSRTNTDRLLPLSDATIKHSCPTEAQTKSHDSMSSENVHNKENMVRLMLNIDMQDERAQPKYRDMVDLYQRSGPRSSSGAN